MFFDDTTMTVLMTEFEAEGFKRAGMDVLWGYKIVEYPKLGLSLEQQFKQACANLFRWWSKQSRQEAP